MDTLNGIQKRWKYSQTMNKESRRSFLRNSALAAGAFGLVGTRVSAMSSSSEEMKKGMISPIEKKLSFNQEGKLKYLKHEKT